MLISLLLPTLSKARAQANKLQCMSNLKQLGTAMLFYAESNRGYMFPPGKGWKTANGPTINDYINKDPIPGTNPVQPDLMPWYLFKVWNPPVMLCPSDLDPGPADHSYMINAHLEPKSMSHSVSTTEASTEQDMKYSSVLPAGRTPSDIIVAGEKVSGVYDYYMEPGSNDFDQKVELHRHGILLGSNYLMLDLHVVTLMPGSIPGGLDPWDTVGGNAVTQQN